MSEDKVNMNYSLTDSSCDNAGEGLCILARMIARRLRARKADVREQHPRPGLPTSGADKQVGLQAPEGVDRKHAVTPSDCSKLDMPDVLTKEGDDDG